MHNIRIETPAKSNIADVERLLEAAKLPIAGVRDCIESTIVAWSDDRIIGSAALEIYPSGVLLRSVAVDEAWRGHGLGEQLTEAALALALRRGATVAFLLTTTASDFFPRFGFMPINRDDVPDDVRESVEFTSACPSTATVMRADLAH
jgi:amino-acid N-acetyltransferase